MTGQLIGIERTLAEHRAQFEVVIEQLVQGDHIAGTQALQRLRDRFGDELARIISVAGGLQCQARTKLGPPDSPSRIWWVGEKSLQQATPWQVARLKATWFDRAAVHDLCCGIGGDAIQLAARGELTAVELDPVTAMMAGANLDLAGYPESRAKTIQADVTALELPKSAAIHIDPDRRPAQHRRSDPGEFQPSWHQVSELVAGSAAAIVKLAPVSRVPEVGLPASEFHRCWIALSGSVREQSLLWGSVIERAGQVRGQRSAVVMRADGSFTWFAPEKGIESVAPRRCVNPPLLLVDPSSAIRAAGLTEAFANQFDLSLLSGPAGFLAGEIELEQVRGSIGSLGVFGTVRWWGTCDDRKLRKAFRARGVFPQTIKVRGTDHDPSLLVKRYRGCGEHPVTLWIGRHGKRVFAAITD